MKKTIFSLFVFYIFCILCCVGCKRNGNNTDPTAIATVTISSAIVFIDDVGHIYVVNDDGTCETLVMSTGPIDTTQGVSWSPDRSKLIFSRFIEYNGYKIYTIDARGGNEQLLTNDFLDNRDPSYSPDGSKIVFAQGVLAPGFNKRLYSMDANGNSPTDLLPSASIPNVSNPDWSPDGTKIVFASDSGWLHSGDWDNSLHIYKMDSNGNNLVALAYSIGSQFLPRWSPDNSKILFSQSGEVYVMNADGSNITNLTNNAVVAESCPAWSSDGTKIAFLSAGSTPGVSNIFVMNADGSNQTKITSRTGSVVFIAWR